MATPLFITLLFIEFTDIVFALDSIPAIFGITSDPFIILTSNVFAILGLRALYFLLAGSMDKFHLLNYGLAVVLAFVGVKMLLEAVDVHVNIGISLAFIATTLAFTVVLSLKIPPPHEKDPPREGPPTAGPDAGGSGGAGGSPPSGEVSSSHEEAGSGQG